MKLFNLIHTPLNQANLLEANAGTGKTYSLCFLYIRLLIEKKLSVDEILVTTFTVAATTELKSRIFDSLNTIKKILLALQNNNLEQIEKVDPNWLEWLNIQKKHQPDEVLEKSIRLALCQADKIQIYSIDALALLLLHEHENSTQQFAPNTILENNFKLLKPALISLIQSPSREIQGAIIGNSDFFQKSSSDKLSSCFEQLILHSDKLTQFNKKNSSKKNNTILFEDIIKTILNSDTDGAISQIIDAIDNDTLNKVSYKANKINELKNLIKTKVFYELSNLVQDNIQKSIALLSLDFLTDKIKKSKQDNPNPFTHPIFKLFNQLILLLPNYLIAKGINQQKQLMQIADYLNHVILSKKAEQMTLTYQDIMDAVVTCSKNIETVYKAILVDEAQDLNQQQLTLFENLAQKESTTFFVGDPKQAIYGFRNSDINTYLKLKNSVDHQYLLATNFRSTQTFNKSVNCFFSGEIFSKEINYHAINSYISEDHPHSLHLFSLDTASFADIEKQTAQLIKKKLNTPFFKNNQPLKPNDIAILVRTKKQGQNIQSALNKLNIPSAFLDGKTIFDTPEASYFELWLKALMNLDIKVIKTLMLSPLLAYPINTLDDNNLVNQLRTQFAQLQSKSLSDAFYQFNTQFNVINILQKQTRGQIKLSNWLHIFEITNQQMLQQYFSYHALYDWLTSQIDSPELSSKYQLRLVSTDAVTIMTMHKSKGLEFNVVCLPYIDKPTKINNQERLLVNQKEKMAMMSFIPHKEFKEQIKQEQLEEQIRLLYVGLTRAKYQNIILSQSSSEKKRRSNSTWQILTQSLTVDLTTQSFTQQTIINETDSPDMSNLEESNTNIELNEEEQMISFNQLEKSQLPHWVLSSFSRLHDEAKTYNNNHKVFLKKNNLSEISTLKNLTTELIDNTSSSLLFNLPAGSHIGTAIHSAYEWLMEYRVINHQFISLLDKLFNSLPINLNYHNSKLEQLASELEQTLIVPLFPLNFNLLAIDTAYQSIEMRFFLRLSSSSKQKLAKLFGLSHKKHIETYLHGYIDYCFSHNGKYYILDYKSNYLGNEPQDYNQNKLDDAMQSNQYHLQALIYIIAICQWLQIENESDYLNKIGGAIYLFIRGMLLDKQNTNNPPNGIWHHLFTWQNIKPYLN